jgi:hypothetical protein
VDAVAIMKNEREKRQKNVHAVPKRFIEKPPEDFFRRVFQTRGGTRRLR